MKPAETLISIAKKYLGIHGTNPEIDVFRKALDGKAAGEAWCAAFVGYCLQETEKALSLPCGLILSESCMKMWNSSPKKARISKPEPGAIVVWNKTGTPFGHTGIVLGSRQPETFASIEGNTSPASGIYREGTGVFLKIHSVKGTMSFRLMGYLRPFQQ